MNNVYEVFSLSGSYTQKHIIIAVDVTQAAYGTGLPLADVIKVTLIDTQTITNLTGDNKYD